MSRGRTELNEKRRQLGRLSKQWARFWWRVEGPGPCSDQAAQVCTWKGRASDRLLYLNLWASISEGQGFSKARLFVVLGGGGAKHETFNSATGRVMNGLVVKKKRQCREDQSFRSPETMLTCRATIWTVKLYDREGYKRLKMCVLQSACVSYRAHESDMRPCPIHALHVHFLRSMETARSPPLLEVQSTVQFPHESKV